MLDTLRKNKLQAHNMFLNYSKSPVSIITTVLPQARLLHSCLQHSTQICILYEKEIIGGLQQTSNGMMDNCDTPQETLSIPRSSHIDPLLWLMLFRVQAEVPR